jgi:hypothetical protein
MYVSSEMPIEEYRERLRRYSNEELEGVFFSIHSLQEGERYRLLLDEIDRRGLATPPARDMPPVVDLPCIVYEKPFFRRHPVLRGLVLASASLFVSMGTTLLLLLPVWAFAVPWGFVGSQAALVYLGYLPVPIVLGMDYGRRAGGGGRYGAFALLGVMAGLLLFGRTGAPEAIVQSLALEGRGGGGGMLGGF